MYKVAIIDSHGNEQQSWTAKDEDHAMRIQARQQAKFPVGSSRSIRITKTR